MRLVCITRPQSLWRRYVLGLAIVCLTISAAHYFSIGAISGADADADASHISTRQVMLSQRILFLMRESERRGSPEIDARLASAIQLFETSHDWLTNRANLSPELRALYFEDEAFPLDYFSRRFVETARYSLQASGQVKTNMQNQLVSLGQQDLLVALSTAARLHQTRADAQNRWLHSLETIALAGAVIVLLLEALFIFLPAQVSVNRTIKRLERRGRQLTSSFNALRQRNAELLAARNNLAHAANHDALTGLLNRRALYDYLSRLEDGSGGEVTVGVMKLDLDRFKAINDSLGHKAGDDVLIKVARLLLDQARADDLVARIGGDEFVIVMKAPKSVEALEQLGHRLVTAISQPIMIEDAACEIGASIGFTIATSAEATPDQLLIEADLALYEAKRSGRGQVFAHSCDLREEFERRRILFAQIDAALAADQFEPHFQPQLCTRTGKLSGCEVLARWRHPERGIVPPATFIAAAEEAGLIRQIDLIMVEKGLDLLESLRDRGYVIPSISVNVSPATLRDPNLSDRLLQEVLARGMTPHDLTVEILETTLIRSEDDHAILSVEQLKKAGFSVVLDDFGTGYASMSTLSRLLFDGIKLDRSLIAPIPNDRAESIVAALTTLSRSLDMRIVAEGVETEEQFSRVKAHGCDVVQGFLVGHPMDAEAFALWYDGFAAAEERRA
ncbi:putative bifunctional diguanylate cyclase/phosphodiesterase [Roseobacter sinensis]|uniref:EAL domain-containing protein n=1 Tax=Roseobacter sinensis TaxID=2931391 RepID=A0ABT3BFM2_9RHOB|nr:EAL domain-containing protein [Roseobacter sp. WL0113]MCV3272386.1 EAL domain-containing protein [Roseobacter sp. WL0113]